MSRRIVVIGGVAGGATVATKLRRLSEKDIITIVEKDEHVSFSNCSLPYYLGGFVEEADELVLMNPDKFHNNYNITALTGHEAIRVDRDEKLVEVLCLSDMSMKMIPYDKLIIATGAKPIVPKIEGLDLIDYHTVRNVKDVVRLRSKLDSSEIKNIAVIGGGFIGLEVVENLVHYGKKVSLIEAGNQVLAPLDPDMASIVHKSLIDEGVDLHLNDSLIKVTSSSIILSSGKEIKADIVVFAIGVKPDIKLAVDAGLKLGTTGGILVNESFTTSDPSIYAVGDSVEVFHHISGEKTKLALAGPAQKEARIAANHINGDYDRTIGVIGSSALRLFNYNIAFTGLSEKRLKQLNIIYDYSFVIPSDKVSVLEGASPVFFKLLFERPTGKLLGAQAIGEGDAVKRVDVVSALLIKNGTLEDLKQLELCYSPIFSTAKDIVNYAGLVGMNILENRFRQISVSDFDKVINKEKTIIDVRERDEFEEGHILEAINIPMSELRLRINEIPTNEEVYIYCRTGQRSYNVICFLQNMGYTNVVNIAGSFLGYCTMQYAKDKLDNLVPKVTAYKFE
ncbi:MAG: FAD-dependent oxidoreductase [Tissierellia bacterium]|nr:FAD-dependent oxidoreductase [Tissierellia bacterium]